MKLKRTTLVLPHKPFKEVDKELTEVGVALKLIPPEYRRAKAMQSRRSWY
jgi:hypothetical protein